MTRIPDEITSQLVGIPGTCFVSSAALQELVGNLRHAEAKLPALSVLEVRVLSLEHRDRHTVDDPEFGSLSEFNEAYRNLWEAHANLLARLERQAQNVLKAACGE